MYVCAYVCRLYKDSINSFKGGYTGDNIGQYFKGC